MSRCKGEEGDRADGRRGRGRRGRAVGAPAGHVTVAPPVEVRLSDGRVARVHDYDPERGRAIACFMVEARIPHAFPLAIPIHAALLALMHVDALDGVLLVWPAPTVAGIDRFIKGFRGRDLEMLARRYVRTVPRGVPIRPFWKVAAEGGHR